MNVFFVTIVIMEVLSLLVSEVKVVAIVRLIAGVRVTGIIWEHEF